MLLFTCEIKTVNVEQCNTKTLSLYDSLIVFLLLQLSTELFHSVWLNFCCCRLQISKLCITMQQEMKNGTDINTAVYLQSCACSQIAELIFKTTALLLMLDCLDI